MTLDGDVDFEPKALWLLLDRMKKNSEVGAVCGRIHPIGSGTEKTVFSFTGPCLNSTITIQQSSLKNKSASFLCILLFLDLISTFV